MPIDLYDYNELVERIRNLDPGAVKDIPPPSKGGAAYHAATDLYKKLSGPKFEPLTAADRAYIDANKLRNEVATMLANHVKQGVVDARDVPFPDEDLPRADQVRALNGMKARLERAWEEAHWSPEHRAKVALHEVQALKAEMLSLRYRVNELEQGLCARDAA